MRDYRPDLVLRDAAEMASWALAEQGGVPGITMFCTTHRQLRREFAWPGGPDLSRMSAVSLFPASFDPVDGLPEPHRFRSGEAVRPASPRVTPLVYVSYGTVLSARPAGVARLREVVSALAGLPVELVVSIGQSDPDGWGELGRRADLRPWRGRARWSATAARVRRWPR
jgi:hypothetical protein